VGQVTRASSDSSGVGVAASARTELWAGPEFLGGLDGLGPAWERLLEGGRSPTLGHAWACAWAEARGDELRVRVLSVPGDGGPGALLALGEERSRPGVLAPLGAPSGYPTGVPAAGPRELEALCQMLVRQRAAIHFMRVQADDPLVGAVRRLRRRALVFCRPVGGMRYLELEGDWSEPERRLHARLAKSLRRSARLAAGVGEVSYQSLAPIPAELPPLLEEALRVEAAGWKGRGRTALAHDPVLGEVFRRYLAAAAADGTLRMFFMRVDGRAVATYLTVQTGRRLWGMKMGYDEAFARCSPGALMQLHTIRYAAQQGLESFELLGDEPWMARWTDTVRPCVGLRVYPIAGGARGILDDVRRAARLRLGPRGRVPRGAPRATTSGSALESSVRGRAPRAADRSAL
jgi:CelD/BcsL family acetyltransferase involved in cellulose biosynthesis